MVPGKIAAALFLVLLGLAPGLARAADTVPNLVPPTKMTQEQIDEEAKQSWAAARDVAVHGPASVTLEQGTLQLPEHTAYIPMPVAGRLMRSMGNSIGPSFIGLAVSTRDEDNGMAAISYHAEGHVSDADARDWDADDLLQSLKAGSEEDNRDRVARGFDPLDIDGWEQAPRYDETTHRLVWSLAAHVPGDTGPGVLNYNTYLLGREGYYSLDYITDSSRIEAEKPVALAMLGGLRFADGKRYEDFNDSTDHLAAYGLAALVGGVALKKVGLLALGAAFAAKFAKAGILLALAVFAGARKLLGRRPGGRRPGGRGPGSGPRSGAKLGPEPEAGQGTEDGRGGPGVGGV